MAMPSILSSSSIPNRLIHRPWKSTFQPHGSMVLMRDKQRCQQCKKITSNVIINSTRYLKDGTKRHSYMCNPCNAKRIKEYYHKNKERVREIIYKSTSKHYAKQKARLTLNYHVNAGNITKPLNCERCATNKTRIEGHHDDYSKPLEVMWLCTRCHGDRHRELREKKSQIVYTWVIKITNKYNA